MFHYPVQDERVSIYTNILCVAFHCRSRLVLNRFPLAVMFTIGRCDSGAPSGTFWCSGALTSEILREYLEFGLLFHANGCVVMIPLAVFLLIGVVTEW